MYERPGNVLGGARRGEIQEEHSQESQNGEVCKSASGNDTTSDTVLDRMHDGDSNETTVEVSDSSRDDGAAFKRPRMSRDENLKALDNIWNRKASKNKNALVDMIQETRKLLFHSVAELIQDGKKAHHQWARVQQELDLANEYISSKTNEIERLRAMDSKNRENISVRIFNNLLILYCIEFSASDNRSCRNC